MLERKGFHSVALIVICLLSYAGYSAGAWVPFTGGSITPPRINLIESNNNRVSFSVEVYGMNSEDTLVEGTLYQKINIPDHWFYEETGFPKIPVVNVLLAIPDCDSATLSITPTDSLEYEEYNVYPMPRFRGDREGILLEEEFTKNDSIYSIDAYFPNSFGRIAESGAIRGQKIVRVEIYPTQFNPVTHKLKVYTDYEVELTFTNPTSGVNENTGIFSNICGNTILNYEFSGLNASGSVGTGEKGSVTRVTSIPNPWTGPAFDYLIITYDDLFNSSYLDQIAYRRANYNGFDVVIVKVDDIYAGYPTSGDYWNEESIRNFIQSVYENGTANHTYDGKLGYVLLVGDANNDYNWPYEGEDKTGPPTPEYENYELVPTSYVYQHTEWVGGNHRWEELGDASDYYYSCITEESGNYDDYPDIMIGRISVGNETELSTVADKIVNYEPMPLEASWKKNILLVGGGPRGGWDTWYSSDPEFNEIATNIIPTEYWTTYVTQHLPTSVPADEIFYDDVTTDPHGYLYVRPFIADNLNEGQLITNYMGHGWGWDVQLLRPGELSNGDILNSDRLSFILAMACEVGMFDLTEEGNIHDRLPYISGVWDCSAEIYINNFVSGAIGYVAASRASYASSFGTIDRYTQEAIFKNHSYVLGEAVMEAKLKTVSLLYRRQYNFFGDPALNIMLEEPIGYTQDSLATARNNQRKLAKDSNNKFHLVYQSWAGGNELVFHMTSTENEEWATRTCIGEGKSPAIAIDKGDGINVCWIKEDVSACSLFFARNDGSGWTEGVLLLERDSHKEAPSKEVRFSPPGMVVDNNNIAHIVVEVEEITYYEDWIEYHWELDYLTYPVDKSASPEWETLSLCDTVLDNPPPPTSSPSIDVDMNNNPHIVWDRDRINYKTKPDGGWIEEIVAEGSKPFIDVTDNCVHIVWEYDNDIYHTYKEMGGGWEVPGNISQSTRHSESPQILDGVVCVWSEYVYKIPNGTPHDDYEVFYKVREGSEWEERHNLSNTSQDSKYPQIALKSPEGILSVAWTEGNDSPYEVKFKQTNFLPPLPPQGLSGVWKYIGRDKADITLHWNPNSELDLSGYYVYRSTSSGGPFDNIGTAEPIEAPVFVDRVYAWRSYWYYVTAFDIAGNESSPSDTIKVDPEFYPGPCPFLFTWNGSEFVGDNNILVGSELGEVGTDAYKLTQPLVETDPPRRYKIEIREEETEHSFFDWVTLLTVDHPENVEVGVNTEGEVVPVTTAHTPVAAVSGGEDYADVLGDEESWFEGCAGDTMVVGFGTIDETENKELWLNSDKSGYPISIEIERDAGWEYVTSLFPRENYSTIPIASLPELIDDGEALALRLAWFADHNLKNIRIVQLEDVSINENTAPLTSAIHSRLGDVRQELLNEDEEYAEVLPGDTLRLEFAVTGQTLGWTRSFLFVSNGYYIMEGGGGAQTAFKNIPVVHSLSLYPNPARNDMNIRFGIPREERISLKLYDISGRRVKRLVDDRVKAGYYVIKLDSKNLPSGIYFARLRTDTYMTTKKLVLMK